MCLSPSTEAILNRAAKRRAPGRFQLEAPIQSAHVAGRLAQKPVHNEVVALYQRLMQIAPTLGAQCGPCAAMVEANNLAGAAKLLESLDENAGGYQPYWVVRASY